VAPSDFAVDESEIDRADDPVVDFQITQSGDLWFRTQVGRDQFLPERRQLAQMFLCPVRVGRLAEKLL